MTHPAARATAAALAAVILAGCASTGEPVQGSATEVREFGEEGAGALTQTFVPRGGSLSRVVVWSATYGVTGPDAVIRLDLSGAGQQRTALVGHADLGDNQRVVFTFPPVDGAAGEVFAARFSAEGTDPVGLYANPNDPYADGTLTPGPGDLAFEIGHGDRLGEALAALGRVGREARARFADDPAFTVLWVLALIGLAVSAVRLRRRDAGRRTEI